MRKACMYGEIAAQKFDLKQSDTSSNTVLWSGQLYILAIPHHNINSCRVNTPSHLICHPKEQFHNKDENFCWDIVTYMYLNILTLAGSFLSSGLITITGRIVSSTSKMTKVDGENFTL